MASRDELDLDITELKTLNEILQVSPVATFYHCCSVSLIWVQKIYLELAWYICAMVFLKLSLAVFFLRVCIERWQRWIIYGSASIYTLYAFAYLFVAVFECGNPANILVFEIEGRCIPWSVLGPINYIHGSLNAVTDWIFAILPIFVLYKSNLPSQAKYSACGILALGALGSICSLVRLGYIHVLDEKLGVFFRDAASIAIASVIETGLGITAASLATLRPLFQSCMESHRTGKRNPKMGIQKRIHEDPEQGSAEDHGELAPYGFADDTKIDSSESNIWMGSTSTADEMQLADVSGFASHLPFDGRPAHPNREASHHTKHLDDLHAARAAYEERKWTGEGEFVAPNLLLPDI